MTAEGGILGAESAALLTQFFQRRRTEPSRYTRPRVPPIPSAAGRPGRLPSLASTKTDVGPQKAGAALDEPYSADDDVGGDKDGNDAIAVAASVPSASSITLAKTLDTTQMYSRVQSSFQATSAQTVEAKVSLLDRERADTETQCVKPVAATTAPVFSTPASSWPAAEGLLNGIKSSHRMLPGSASPAPQLPSSRDISRQTKQPLAASLSMPPFRKSAEGAVGGAASELLRKLDREERHREAHRSGSGLHGLGRLWGAADVLGPAADATKAAGSRAAASLSSLFRDAVGLVGVAFAGDDSRPRLRDGKNFVRMRRLA